MKSRHAVVSHTANFDSTAGEICRTSSARRTIAPGDLTVRANIVPTDVHAGSSILSFPIVADLEMALACDIAVQFRELEVGGEREVLPCSAVLRNVVMGVGALFGHPANITLTTKIEEVSLPAYKRRALVLAAAELVSNALLHAFHGRRAGLIDVCLTANGAGSACLRVADNGIGFTGVPANLACGIAAALAGLVEAGLAYDLIAGWTIAEIAFPVTGL
jgi:hypothetical protein